jgi:hypothetical protein
VTLGGDATLFVRPLLNPHVIAVIKTKCSISVTDAAARTAGQRERMSVLICVPTPRVAGNGGCHLEISIVCLRIERGYCVTTSTALSRSVQILASLALQGTAIPAEWSDTGERALSGMRRLWLPYPRLAPQDFDR